ncbi:SDR family oxidoreductase [Pontivivens insulae]|uniref:Putative oxidoreductase n=1 Tax=Pontivivens insulae TaxID=1639689 RepID=A0A2R8ABN8_9RHOB|nr:SDR family oxidoreductase [Pontivivens insulae]RED11163.1 NADP-dependent 3-hydroxy acid dehydrogenase YdfG [Pontivivens insulae]SPF29663.1 putative oxidoreductase [Pontivivens insulae]
MTCKTLFLTGASSGIGEATARAAVASGWNVALTARSEDKIEALAQELGEAAISIPCDATDHAALVNAVDKTVAEFGGIDAAFANAGRGAGQAGTQAGDPEDWRGLIDVNVMGPLYTAHAVLPELKKRKGHFLVTGSAAGRRHIKGSIYGATKWFVHGFGGNLAEEMKEWGGRCTIIAPGMVNTAFFDDAKPDKLQPQDIANAVVYALQQPAHVAVNEVFVMPANPS